MRRAFLLIALVFGSLAPAPAEAPAQGQGLTPRFSWAGRDCPDILVVVPFSFDEARAVVPERFNLLRPAQGFVEVLTCEPLTIDGEPAGNASIALAGVAIESPEGRPGSPLDDGDYYALWHLTDLPALRAKTARVGLRGAVVPGITLEPTPFASVTGRVPWPKSPHALAAHAAPVPIRQPPREFVFWHVGSHGLVRYSVRATSTSSFGPGSVQARADSPMARLLGSASAVGLGSYNRIDFDIALSSTRAARERCPARGDGGPRRGARDSRRCARGDLRAIEHVG